LLPGDRQWHAGDLHFPAAVRCRYRRRSPGDRSGHNARCHRLYTSPVTCAATLGQIPSLSCL